jgi:hypothetical protein
VPLGFRLGGWCRTGYSQAFSRRSGSDSGAFQCVGPVRWFLSLRPVGNAPRAFRAAVRGPVTGRCPPSWPQAVAPAHSGRAIPAILSAPRRARLTAAANSEKSAATLSPPRTRALRPRRAYGASDADLAFDFWPGGPVFGPPCRVLLCVPCPGEFGPQLSRQDLVRQSPNRLCRRVRKIVQTTPENDIGLPEEVSFSEVVCTGARGIPGSCRRVWTLKCQECPARKSNLLNSPLHQQDLFQESPAPTSRNYFFGASVTPAAGTHR